MVEADEYDRSFLQLTPTIAVITNIEPEHLDVYGSFSAIEEAFEAFARNVRCWELWLYAGTILVASVLRRGCRTV